MNVSLEKFNTFKIYISIECKQASISAFASFREISDAFIFLSVSFNFTGVEELVAKCVL
jgi:hypothetical protein